MSPLLRFAFSLAAALLLSGCILDRLWETHRQLYAKEPQVLIENAPGEGPRFRFLRPTLLEKDIDWLVGQPPTRVTSRGEERFAEYVLVQERQDHAGRLPLKGQFRYVRTAGEYRLAEIDLPKVASFVFTPQMISAAIEALRHPAPDLLKRRLHLDLKSFHDIDLPNRRQIEQIIGPANQPNDPVADYHFHLLLPGDLPLTEGHVIDITLHYDARGRIRQAEGHYLRYHMRVDMDAAEAVLNVQ
jgi:hypothetical protein